MAEPLQALQPTFNMQDVRASVVTGCLKCPATAAPLGHGYCLPSLWHLSRIVNERWELSTKLSLVTYFKKIKNLTTQVSESLHLWLSVKALTAGSACRLPPALCLCLRDSAWYLRRDPSVESSLGSLTP